MASAISGSVATSVRQRDGVSVFVDILILVVWFVVCSYLSFSISVI
jgi:hypothetical protein